MDNGINRMRSVAIRISVSLIAVLTLATTSCGSISEGGGVQSVTASKSASPIPAATLLSAGQRQEVPLPEAREETAAVTYGGQLYVVGGFDKSSINTSSVLIFDGHSWSDGPSLPLPLDHMGAAVVDAHLYVVGGFTRGRQASSQAFVLNSSNGAWEEMSSLHHARGALALVSLNDRLFAIGGKDGSDKVAQVEQYQPATNAWVDISTLPQPRYHLSGFVYQGQPCVAGGRTPATTAEVDCLALDSMTWHRLPDLPQPTSGAGIAATYAGITVAGGELANETAIISQVMRWETTGWRQYSMLAPRHGFQLATFQSRLWACGGGDAPGLHPVSVCTSLPS